MKKEYTHEKVLEIRQDIMKATEKLYKKSGYEFVNLLRISKLTHLSRPSLYNYYHCKEEIFLDIILREYNSFGAVLKKTLTKEKYSKEQLANKLTSSILNNLYLLDLVSSYENQAEEASSIEHLKEYREGWENGFYKDIMESISFQFPNASEDTKDTFINLLLATLYGIYPIICPSEEKISAMKERGKYKPVDRNQFVNRTMSLLLTNID